MLHNTQKLLRVNRSKRFQAQSTGESRFRCGCVDVDGISDLRQERAKNALKNYLRERKKALPQ
jgi:hypothetical protein